jgi:hypothetical protein
MTVNSQQLASIARQGLAILGIVFGVLTQSVGSLHLPVAVSTALAIGGTVILAIEHYVSDPSTGSTTTGPTPNAPPVVPPTA